MKIVILLNLCFVFLASNIFAAPVVTSTSGNVENGENVTISGIDFGIKSNGQPVAHYSFNSGTQNELVSESGELNDASSKFTYVLNGHSGMGIFTNKVADGTSDSSYIWFDCGSSCSQEIYWSFWAKIIILDADRHDEGNGNQLKWYTVRSDPYVATSGWGSYPWMQENEDGQFEWRYMGDTAVRDGVYATPLQHHSPAPDPAGEWFRIEVYGKRNSGANVSDGEWHVVDLRPVTNSAITVFHDSNFNTHGEDDREWRYCEVLNNLTNTDGRSEVDIYFDDWYIDNTRARVEIGNNETFSDCSYREIQTPTAWSNNSINITVNQGLFDEVENVYLFVIDEDGNASEGYPIIINGSGSLTADVNSDGQVNIQDVIMCVNIIHGAAGNADVNGDEQTNEQDVVDVVSKILGQ